MGMGRRPELSGNLRVDGLPRGAGLYPLWHDALVSRPRMSVVKAAVTRAFRNRRTDVSVFFQVSGHGLHERAVGAAERLAWMAAAGVDRRGFRRAGPADTSKAARCDTGVADLARLGDLGNPVGLAGPGPPAALATGHRR